MFNTSVDAAKALVAFANPKHYQTPSWRRFSSSSTSTVSNVFYAKGEAGQMKKKQSMFYKCSL
ncbi:hypothetical protein JG688_00000663 [Phytophthora aleatoria]|uniref:Uncharacterized protein n=1 Tax=Phytophthora aleatoria TaxID=2496075 RepID=A0A8J5IWS6_9STRA|nr:hypothetical protein JG688_00000663 [Phytophthora aleatoria]